MRPRNAKDRSTTSCENVKSFPVGKCPTKQHRGQRLAPATGDIEPLMQAYELIDTLYGTLRDINPRWIDQCALWLEEHIVPYHADAPLLPSLVAHLHRVAKVTEDAWAKTDKMVDSLRQLEHRYPSPHSDFFLRNRTEPEA